MVLAIGSSEQFSFYVVMMFLSDLRLLCDLPNSHGSSSCLSLNLFPRYHPNFFSTVQEFKNALKEDTVDYSIYTANIKRKRPPSRRGGRSGRMAGRDDDDDDEDNDWGSGARRPNNSGRKSNSSRGRQWS